MILVLAIVLIRLTGPDNQAIHLNKDEIVSLRVPRDGDHFATGVQCLIHTSDGKVITVKESCIMVKKIIERSH